MSKRKTIRSEARNQVIRNPNEGANLMNLNQEFILKRSSNSNSVEPKQSESNKRNRINFNCDENPIYPNEELKSSTNNNSDHIYVNGSEDSQNLRKSIKIEKQFENVLDENIASYRLPSISPSSKLPSCFTHKRSWKNKLISKQNKSVEDNREQNINRMRKPDTSVAISQRKMKNLNLQQPKHSSRLSFQITKKQGPESFGFQGEASTKKSYIPKENSQKDISTASTKSRNLYDYITSRAYSIKYQPYNVTYCEKKNTGINNEELKQQENKRQIESKSFKNRKHPKIHINGSLFMVENDDVQIGTTINSDLKKTKSNECNANEKAATKFFSNHKENQKVYIVDTYDLDDPFHESTIPYATFRATPANKNRQAYQSNDGRSKEASKTDVGIAQREALRNCDFKLKQEVHDFSKKIFGDEYQKNIFGQVVTCKNSEQENDKANISTKNSKIKKSKSSSKNVFKCKKKPPQTNNLEEKSFDSRSSSIHLIMKQDQL